MEKQRKPIYKKWWFWLIAVVIVGSIGSNIGKDEPKKVGTSAPVEEKKEDAKKNEPKIFKVGDAVQLKDFKITVNKVYTVAGDEFSKPQEGNEFLAVDCTVENTSDKEQAVSSMMMFKVVDKDGRACEYSLLGQTAAKAGQLDGTIGAGRKLTGVYVVEVPKGKKGLELVFEGALLTKGQVIVELR